MRTHGRSQRSSGFTLVELLVVIGIIAVLISILLPSLNKARSSAQNVQCLSNLKQMVQATRLFAADHRGIMPTASDHFVAITQDHARQKYTYRDTGFVQDWASALLPYMGAKGNLDFEFAPDKQNKVFVCPSDAISAAWTPGMAAGKAFTLFNNVTQPTQRISYGINGDIACNIVNNQYREPSGPTFVSGYGYYTKTNYMAVYRTDAQGKGITGGDATYYQACVPLNGVLSRVHRSTEVMLFGDCGTLPRMGSYPLDYPDSLVYTTNSIVYSSTTKDKFSLAGVAETSWLGNRIPLDRHGARNSSIRTAGQSLQNLKGGKMNIAFVDGHCASVGYSEFNKVYVSPYAPNN